MGKTKPTKLADTKLKRIEAMSREDPACTFECLMPHYNKENLIACYHELDGKKAVGVDKQTKDIYGANLEVNIANLITRMKSMSYRPQPVREVRIPKDDGKTRPLGIACIEDKIVQSMTAKLLEAIYEPTFTDESFGFRPGRNCHQAIREVHQQVFRNWENYVIDVDLENFFGEIDHSKLLTILRMRIKDEKFIRYIARALKSGVLSDEGFRKTEMGSAQGSVCSPILANIFAHYAIDVWVKTVVEQKVEGAVKLVRYCDDFVICCTNRKDAKRVLRALPKRLERFSLKVNSKKTQCIEMCKKASRSGRSGTFNFLGFTFYLGPNARGYIIPKVKTDGKKYRKKLKEVNQWCKDNRHLYPLKSLWDQLRVKMRGYIRYYGVSHNSYAVSSFIFRVTRVFFKWINRRSHRKSVTWEQLQRFIRKYPMPPVKVYHRLF